MELLRIKGIKEKRRDVLVKEGIATIEDLLWYVPYGYLDRSTVLPINRLREAAVANPRQEVTVVARVVHVRPVITRNGRRFLTLSVTDQSGYVLKCYWFNGVQFFEKAFEAGEVLALSAVPSWDKRGQDVIFTHPKFDRFRSTEEGEPDWDRMFNTGRIIPKYSSNADLQRVGLDSSRLRWIIRNALTPHIERIPECLPEWIRTQMALPERRAALLLLHQPESLQEVAAAQRRFSFDELFFLQVMHARLRREIKSRTRNHSITTDGPLSGSLRKSLPFELTQAQRRVLEEIRLDLRSASPMNRLLQGDVGSGKTVVAMIAAAMIVDSGMQVAFMAPTEILAEQHFRTASALLEGLPINIRLLVGGQKKRLREDILGEIRSGRAQVVIGTHALIEESVAFARLGLTIIDEQHRFGVEQRGALTEKGDVPDLLVMTATPIPRTLQMAKYASLDVSRIDELPPGRRPVRTVVMREKERERIFTYIRAEAGRGRQAYVVYPLIDESDKVEWKAAASHFEQLQKRSLAGLRVGLLHGRMKSGEKDDVMSRFKAGEIQVLVSTTVIEVGIDVPNATVMVIENAERFGLAQLHQLRGRVGRGAEQSFCVLVTSLDWTDADETDLSASVDDLLNRVKIGRAPGVESLDDRRRALARLWTMQKSADGFAIAEIDLFLRSSFFLTFDEQQSGMKRFSFAELPRDEELLTKARDVAFALVDRDPHLRERENELIASEFARTYERTFLLGRIF